MQTAQVVTNPYSSKKNRTVALLLCIFLGASGAHRFYVHKVGTGVLWLLTGGLLGIGVLVDLIMIAVGSFTDEDYYRLTEWEFTNADDAVHSGSDKNRLVALLLGYFFGFLGVHRFYVGKIGTGLVWLFTFGCLGIGVLVDMIMIFMGSFEDKDGFPVSDWRA